MIDYIIYIYTACGEKNIVTLIEEFKDDLNDFFRQNPIALIVEDFKKNTNNISIGFLIKEPSGLLHIALFTNAIYLRLCENDYLDRVTILKNAFKDLIANQVSSIINNSKHQLIKLCEFLDKIVNQCLNKNPETICILELPVGNSIPSILLQHIFELKGRCAKRITISLNRNDSKQKGITRTELIQDKLKEISLESTILIYVDEWITGSNFNNIIKILSKIKRLHFFPCAFMTSESPLKSKYSQYELEHKRICADMRLKSEDLIIELPTLNPSIDAIQKFIWTESDRLAGYRKLEFFGSIVSTFLAIGELLLDDPIKLNETLGRAIDEHSTLEKGTEISYSLRIQIMNSFEYFNTTFASELEEKIKNVEINNSLEFDLETELTKVISLLKNTKGYSNAQPAINIISYHMKNTVISPSSRYFYKGHVPLCLALEGDEKYLNSIFIEKIKNYFLKSTR